MSNNGEEAYRQSDEMQCGVVLLEYDYVTKSGYLRMAEGHCCDMYGCIRSFEKIDSEVARIATFSGESPDTQYYKLAVGWGALGPNERRGVPRRSAWSLPA